MIIQEVHSLLPIDFPAHAKVWVYQSSRAFIQKEQDEINEQLEQFYTQWMAHGAPVKGWAKVLFGQFIVVMADESKTVVSGCSTDSSVRIVKSIERQYSVNMFDRLSITFLLKGKAEMLPLNQIQYAIDKGFIDGDTYLFNNTVYTKKDLEEHWLIPLRESWIAERINLSEQDVSLN